MFFFLSKTISFFLTPTAWIVGAAVVALWVKNPKKRRRWSVITAGLIIFFTNPWLSEKAFSSWEREPTDFGDKAYDVVVILTGMTHGNVIIKDRVQFHDAAERFIEPIRLYHLKKVKKILISGGSGILSDPEFKESRLLERLAEQLNIPSKDLVIEDQSQNTYENAKYTAAILKEKFEGRRILLVTSAFHMRRAEACFVKQGVNAISYPVDFRVQHSGFSFRGFVPSLGALVLWSTLFHELFGFVIYKVMGYL